MIRPALPKNKSSSKAVIKALLYLAIFQKEQEITDKITAWIIIHAFSTSKLPWTEAILSDYLLEEKRMTNQTSYSYKARVLSNPSQRQRLNKLKSIIGKRSEVKNLKVNNSFLCSSVLLKTTNDRELNRCLLFS